MKLNEFEQQIFENSLKSQIFREEKGIKYFIKNNGYSLDEFSVKFNVKMNYLNQLREIKEKYFPKQIITSDDIPF